MSDAANDDEADADDADSPALIVKRTRRAFTPGAYPTHVFLQVSAVDQRSQALLRRTFRDFGRIGVVAWTSPLLATLHVSLCRSAPVELQYGATLESELRRAVHVSPRDEPTVVAASAVKLLSSEDFERTFLALLLDRDSAAGRRVLAWIAAVDRVFAQFGLRPYHESPLPHVSIASVGESIAALQCACDEPSDECCALQEARHDEFLLSDAIEFRVDALVVQSGSLRVEVK
jgi:hypothetical protein